MVEMILDEIFEFKNEIWQLVGHMIIGRFRHGMSVIQYDDIRKTCDPKILKGFN